MVTDPHPTLGDRVSSRDRSRPARTVLPRYRRLSAAAPRTGRRGPGIGRGLRSGSPGPCTDRGGGHQSSATRRPWSTTAARARKAEETDPVAGHGDHLPLRLQRVDDAELVLGRDAREDSHAGEDPREGRAIRESPRRSSTIEIMVTTPIATTARRLARASSWSCSGVGGGEPIPSMPAIGSVGHVDEVARALAVPRERGDRE